LTTDPQDELFDVLDERGNPTGVAKPRRLVHRDGDWHRGLHIWVGGVRDGMSFVLFQRRSLTKDTWPGALDVAIGGHVRAGETLEETVREAEEEIGLVLTVADLVAIGRRWVRGGQPPVRDNELNEVFAVRCDQPLDAYQQHPEEVDAVVAVAVEDALRLFRRETPRVKALEHAREETRSRLVTVARDEVASRLDDYPLLAIASLAQVLRGETPEPWEILPGH
jgi:isopentenyldiphosphate isomerase